MSATELHRKTRAAADEESGGLGEEEMTAGAAGAQGAVDGEALDAEEFGQGEVAQGESEEEDEEASSDAGAAAADDLKTTEGNT